MCIEGKEEKTSPTTCSSINLIFLKKAATAAVMARRESLNWFLLNHTYTYCIPGPHTHILYDTAHSKYLSHHVNVIYVQPQSKKSEPNSNSIGFSNNFRFADTIKYKQIPCVYLNNLFLIHTPKRPNDSFFSFFVHYRII